MKLLSKLSLGAVLFFCTLGNANGLKIQGSTTVAPVVTEAAETFRNRGWRILVDTQGGSAGGISGVGDGRVDIGMISKPVSENDRKRYPAVNFVETEIGYDGVALVVSKQLYAAGIRALSKDQIQKVYELKVRSWKEIGGPDKPVVFFNKEPGRGTWEIFAHFLYGHSDKAPLVTHAEVGGNEEGRTKVAQHTSAISQLSASWASDSSGVRAIGIIPDGAPAAKAVLPTSENILSGVYPMRRSLSVLTNGKPTGAAKEFIEFLLSPTGQTIIAKNGYLKRTALP